MKARHLLFVLSLLSMAACQSVEKMIDTGNYDAAMIKSQKKLEGKRNLKTRYVKALEEAFAKANARDLRLTKRLDVSKNSSEWARILDIYDRIDRRQEGLSSLLPIVSKDGYRAEFRFVKVADLSARAAKRYTELLMREALALMTAARVGDKNAARSAHDRLEEYLVYAPYDAEASRLLNEALALGMVRVWVRVENRTTNLLPFQFEQNLLSQGMPASPWIEYTLDNNKADHEVRLVLSRADVSPERVLERLVTRTREIEDGYDYVLDAEGNVVKDSTGQDITRPKYKEVSADLISVEQVKSALIGGQIICRDLFSGATEILPIQSEILFENTSARIRGDRRALEDDDRSLLNGRIVPFPSDQALLEDAMARISPLVREKIAVSVFL